MASPNATGIYGAANPCCHCGSGNDFGPHTEPHLGYVDIQTENSGAWYYKSVAHPACDDSVPARISHRTNLYPPPPDIPPICEAVIHNTLHSFYHLLRLDLGVMMNQIFTSSEVFNKTIMTRPVQEWIDSNSSFPLDMLSFWATPTLSPIPQDIQDASLNATVPKAIYLQPRFRPKPLPSAITSVFVATITMVAAIWKVFSIVAGFFVDSTPDGECVNLISEYSR